MKQPRLSAIGILYEIFGKPLFNRNDLPPLLSFEEWELHNLKKMLSSGFQSFPCTSMGRMFDAISSLIDIRHTIDFEGEAAMQIEFMSEKCDCPEHYTFHVKQESGMIDWGPMIKEIIHEIGEEKTTYWIAAKFMNTLVQMIITISHMFKEKNVVLSGGVFQNKILTEKAVHALQENNFKPYWHENIPPNDGGIALGQLVSLLKG